MPVASVVIPTRNRPDKLRRALGSVVGQTLVDWELIIVDDASSEATPNFLAAVNDPRIVIERLEERQERSRARNRGLELVRSPAVLFLDDDDELLPSALAVLLVGLAHHPEACASVGAAIHDTDGSMRRPSFPKRSHVVDVRDELFAGWVALGGQSLMRTKVLRQVGGWLNDLSVAEDQELWLRLCRHGPVAVVPDPVLVHRPHGLEGDAPGHRDIERAVVARALTDLGGARRLQRAAAAREHLRNADVDFQLGAYRSALVSTVKGIGTAPFLLASPLVGPGLTRGLANAAVAAALPRRAVEWLRTAVRRRRAVRAAR